MPSKKISWYKKGKIIEVHDKTQKNYRYSLAMPYGDFSDQPEFQPELSPRTMLRMGVFEGKYLNDTRQEFPSEWFKDARITTTGKPDPQLNCFGIKSRYHENQSILARRIYQRGGQEKRFNKCRFICSVWS